jgi:predicted transcriptional regulator of viral defense system
MNAQNGKSLEFFASHSVFSHGEFLAAVADRGRSRSTANNLLALHLASGRLLRVRRGLYAVLRRGVEPAQADVDSYLVASHLQDDAVVAFHAALQFHGKAYSLWRKFHYFSSRRTRPFSFQDRQFVPVLIPATLRAFRDLGGGIREVRHAGGLVRVTSLERTLVDVLDAPDKGGGWEEIWRSLEMVEFFDLDAVIAYVKNLGSALTVARAGFFLEQHRETLMVEDKHLDGLRALAPAQPRYFDRKREPGKLVSRWNLVVPERILKRDWEAKE